MGCSAGFDLVWVKAVMRLPGLVARALLLIQGRRFIRIGPEDAWIDGVVIHGCDRIRSDLLAFQLLQALLQLLNPLFKPIVTGPLIQQGLQWLGEADLDPLGCSSHRPLSDSGEPESSLHQRRPEVISLIDAVGLDKTAGELRRCPPVPQAGQRGPSARPGAGGHGWRISFASVQRWLKALAWVV